MSAFDLLKFSKSARAAIARLRTEETVVLVAFSHGCIISDLTDEPMGAEAGLGPWPVPASASASASASTSAPASASAPEQLSSHITATLQSLEEFRSRGDDGKGHRIAPRLIATNPGLVYAGSQCIAVPAGIQNFAKITWGVLGTTTGVDYYSNPSVRVKEDALGAQPNTYLHILRDCVQHILKYNPMDSIDDVSKKMQRAMKGKILDELRANIGTEVESSIDALEAAKLNWSAVSATPRRADTDKAIDQLQETIYRVQASEELREALESDRLFKYALHSRSLSLLSTCILNKVYVPGRNKYEQTAGPDWHFNAFARDGRLLVANIIQRTNRKSRISNRWPLEWMAKGPDWFPQIGKATVNDWNMDMIALVEEWKKLKQGGLKRRRDFTLHLYDEMSISTQDILTFLDEVGIVNVILVDCSCNVLASQTEHIVCAPDDVRCKMCSKCGRSMADHAHGGGGPHKRNIKKINNCKKTTRLRAKSSHIKSHKYRRQ